MSDDKKKTAPGVDIPKGQIKFDYLKSPDYRTIYINGVFGGISPRGQIYISVWKERWPIPKQVTYHLKEDGTVTNEIESERIAREAIIREVEVGLLMDIGTAIAMRNWLDEKISIHQQKTERTPDLSKIKTQGEA